MTIFMKKIISIGLVLAIMLSLITVAHAADFSGGGYNFVCAEGGRYLNVYAGKDVDGTNVCVWERDGSPEQSYAISPCGGGKYKLYPACSSSRVIDVNRGNSYNNPLRAGLNVDLWRTNDAPAQEFYITHVGNNLYKIELAALGGHVLQANSPYSNNGNVTLEAYTGASNQHWKILKDGYEVKEPCTHVNVSNKNETKTISQKDDSVHTVVKTYDKICNDCGALISSGIREMVDAAHSLSDNKCLECGFETIKAEEKPTENNPAQEPAQCKHEKTYTTKNSVTYGYPDLNIKVKDDEYHIGYYYADEYCLECNALINKKIIIDEESPHTYWNDTCTGCLHKRKVEVPERTAYVCNTDGDNLNMRSQANTNSSIVTKIPAGATISVTGDAVSGFYPVKYDGKTGYASADYITFTKPATNKTAYVYNTDGANLNMRSGASTSTTIITKIPAGSTITVTGDASNGFYPVKYGNYSGYASTSYITFTKPDVSASITNTNYVWPSSGGYLIYVLDYYYGSSGGGAHPTKGGGSIKGAIDIATSGNALATATGTVIETKYGYNSGWGNYITIKHDDGTYSFYAHLSKINVAVNQRVSAGQGIGVIGTTGNSTGVHLHFEIWDSSRKTIYTIDAFKEKYKKQLVYDGDIVTGGSNSAAIKSWVQNNYNMSGGRWYAK